jgi:hypothetical protein
LFKTFNFGILLGVVGAGLLLLYVPVVDQYREGSLISVQTNGGNSEVFQIYLPRDRIFAGAAGAEEPVPPSLEWPQHPIFANTQTELFKIRNRNDAVVGVASRIASTETADPFIHWMLHLPARGTMFLKMGFAANAEGFRSGTLRAGTHEFSVLSGRVEERFVSDLENAEFDIDGRIEITTAFVAPLEDEPVLEIVE